MTTELAVQVIVSLVAVISALVGVVKFYLPYHDRKLYNPWTEELLGEMRQMHQENREHQTWERATMEEIRRCLERIEAKKSG